jgi:SIR2-like protein
MPASRLSDDDWDLLVSRIRANECLPFLGAGVSISSGPGAGLPAGSQLAESLAAECKYPGSDKWDLFRVCQYYSIARDPHEMRLAIRKRLRVPGIQPTEVHRLLAKLPFAYILTTNFDNLMERALETTEPAGKNPRAEVYVRRVDKKELAPSTVSEPLVYKLHGSIDQVETLIATEDDVIDFAACLLQDDPPLPSLISSLFQKSTLLFIGYGLKDWNVRMMMRALRKTTRRSGPPEIASYAIQRRPKDSGAASEWEKSVMYWDKVENLRCYDVDAQEFLGELVHHYEATSGGTS